MTHCYICDHEVSRPPSPGQPPVCGQCAADSLTELEQQLGEWDDGATDPGVGPVVHNEDFDEDDWIYPVAGTRPPDNRTDLWEGEYADPADALDERLSRKVSCTNAACPHAHLHLRNGKFRVCQPNSFPLAT